MHTHLLFPGTLLDGRYRIEAVLGEGGFGVTYAAQNVRIGLRVAIKELFWRGHSTRDVNVSETVCLPDQADEGTFREQKDRFLKEARTIRDFSALPGVVHILDYFEANRTAYIVMEYVEGRTLAAWLNENGKMEAETLFRLFLPLAQSLESIHAGGVIHRDISPDNMMVQPDGSLKLIDFGAARAFRASGGVQYTAIAKDSYAPGEQYDKNGNQGPWTDVYALCATMYTCLTGAPPVSAVQRMFLDELKPPSQMGASVTAEQETVVMRGLEMTQARRYPGMASLCAAMQAALPKPSPEKKRMPAGWIAAAAAGMLLVLGAWLYHADRAAHPFRGIETETFRLTAHERMTAAAFAQAQDELKTRLDQFAGEKNYLLEVDGDQLEVTLPLACFGGEEISAQLTEHFSDLTQDLPLQLDWEMHIDWEDPAGSSVAGEHQVAASELKGRTAVFAGLWYANLTQGQRANLIMDLKVRLDALDAPYAFGTLYGDENVVAFRIDPAHLNAFVVQSIGSAYGLHVSGEHSDWTSLLKNHSAWDSEPAVEVAEENGSIVLRMPFDMDDFGMQTLTTSMQGQDILYLEAQGGSCTAAIAQTSLAASLESGVLEFRDFRIGDEAEKRKMARYVAALLNDTKLPAPCVLVRSAMLDEEGRTMFDADVSDHYGVPIPCKPSEQALRDKIMQLGEEQGYACTVSRTSPVLYVQLDLAIGPQLAEEVSAVIPALLEEYRLSEEIYNQSVVFRCVDESAGDLCQIILEGGWDTDANRYVPSVGCRFSTDGQMAPYADALIAWWNGFDPSALGFDKN